MIKSDVSIFVVEDNPGDARLIKIQLERQQHTKYKFRTAKRLKDSIEQLREESADLILLDPSLPDSGGMDTYFETQKAHPDIPVIVLTGLSDESLGEQAVKAGAQDFLSKSDIKGDLLDRSIRYSIERFKSNRAIKYSEQKAKESEFFTKGIMNSLSAHIAVLDPKGEIIEANRSWINYTVNFGVDEMGKAGLGENFIHACENSLSTRKDLAQKVLKGIRSIQEGKKKEVLFEFSVNSRAGELTWYILRISPLNTMPGYTVISLMDITRRKVAEERLRREKESAQLILDISEAVFIVLNDECRVQMINSRGCEILGYDESDIVGKDWFAHFVPKAKNDEYRQGFHAWLQADEPEKRIRTESLVKDANGDERSILWSHSLLTDNRGKAIGTLSSGSDITERKKLEAELLHAVVEGEEKERKRLASELHDGLALLLSTAKINLSSIEEAILAIHEDKQKLFHNAISLLDQSMDEVRTIVTNLRSRVLDDFGLVTALEELSDRIRQGDPGLKVHFYQNGLDERLPSHYEMALFRITQELLNNMLKHAEASEVTIQVMMHDKDIALTVEDNGRGFDTKQLKRLRGNGLRNISSRVASLSGEFYIESSPGQGTIAQISIPLPIVSIRDLSSNT